MDLTAIGNIEWDKIGCTYSTANATITCGYLRTRLVQWFQLDAVGNGATVAITAINLEPFLGCQGVGCCWGSIGWFDGPAVK